MYGCEKSNTLVASDREEVIDVRKHSRKVPEVPEETKKNQQKKRTRQPKGQQDTKRKEGKPIVAEKK